MIQQRPSTDVSPIDSLGEEYEWEGPSADGGVSPAEPGTLSEEYEWDLPAQPSPSDEQSSPSLGEEYEWEGPSADEEREPAPERRRLTAMDYLEGGWSSTAAGAAAKLVQGKEGAFTKEARSINDALEQGFYNPGDPLHKDVLNTLAFVAGSMGSPESWLPFGSARILAKAGMPAAKAALRGGGVPVGMRLATGAARGAYEAGVSSAIGQGANVAVDQYQGVEAQPDRIASSMAVSVITGGLLGGTGGAIAGRALPEGKKSLVSAAPQEDVVTPSGTTVRGTGGHEDTARRLAYREEIGELQAYVATAKLEKDAATGLLKVDADQERAIEATATKALSYGYDPKTVQDELFLGALDQGMSLDEASQFTSTTLRRSAEAYLPELEAKAALSFDAKVREGKTADLLPEEQAFKAPETDEIAYLTKEARRIYSSLGQNLPPPGTLSGFLYKVGRLTNKLQTTILADGAFNYRLLSQANKLAQHIKIDPKTGQPVAATSKFDVLASRGNPLVRIVEGSGSFLRQVLGGLQEGPAIFTPSGTRMEIAPLTKVLDTAARNGATQEILEDVSGILHNLDIVTGNKIKGDRLLEEAQALVKAGTSGQQTQTPQFTLDIDKQTGKQFVLDAAGNRVKGKDGKDFSARYIASEVSGPDAREKLLKRLAQYKGNKGVVSFLEGRANITRMFLDEQVRQGELNATTANIILRDNPFYTPVKRKEVPGLLAPQSPTVQSGTELGRAAQERVGSETLEKVPYLDAFVADVVRMANHTETLQRNREALNLLLQAPDEVWETFIYGTTKADFLDAMSKAQKGLFDKKTVNLLEEYGTGARQIAGEPGFDVFVNGVKLRLHIHDSPLFASLARIDERMRGKRSLGEDVVNSNIWEWMGKYTALRRNAITTLDAMFSPITFMKDQAESALRLPKEIGLGTDFIPIYTPLRDWAKTKFKSDPLYHEFLSGLGVTRGSTVRPGMGSDAAERTKDATRQVASAMRSGTRMGRARNALNDVWEAYNTEWVSRFELSSRWSIYKRLREKGVDHEAAVEQAKNISTNLFAQSSSPLFRGTYRLSMFLNAAIQGMNDMARRVRYGPERIIKYGMMTLVPPAALLSSWNMTQVDETGVPITDKYRAPGMFNVALPKELRDEYGMEVISIPVVGFSFSPIFFAVTEELVRHMNGHEPRPAKAAADVTMAVTRGVPTLMSAAPTLVQDVSALIGGVSSQGFPLTPAHLKEESAKEQIRVNTSPIAAAVAEHFGFSPGKTDFVVNIMLPGMTGAIIKDAIGDMINEAAIGPEMAARPEGLGVLGRFGVSVGEATEDYKQFQNLSFNLRPVYDAYNQLEKSATNDTATEEEDDRLNEFMEQYGDLVALYEQLEPIADELKSINASLNSIVQDPSIGTPEREEGGDPTKGAYITSLMKQRDDMLRDFMRSITKSPEWQRNKRDLDAMLYTPPGGKIRATVMTEGAKDGAGPGTWAGALATTSTSAISAQAVADLLESYDKLKEEDIDKKASGISVEFPET